MIFYKTNVVDSKDRVGALLTSAYKDLWDPQKPFVLKLEAIDLMAKCIHLSDVKDRLQFFYDKETNSRLKSLMQEVLEGRYEMEDSI